MVWRLETSTPTKKTRLPFETERKDPQSLSDRGQGPFEPSLSGALFGSATRLETAVQRGGEEEQRSAVRSFQRKGAGCDLDPMSYGIIQKMRSFEICKKMVVQKNEDSMDSLVHHMWI